MTEISQRLKLIASYVPEGSVVADIGTDHAYMPIYLIQNKLASRVIAMDVRRGPLEKAVNNISAAGASDSIEVRLSDGLSALEPGEASVITISGMGGKLMERILTAGKDKISSDTGLIFSPQSEIAHFREYLINEGFITDDEKMLKEDGKYYVVIICHYGNASDAKNDSMYDVCIGNGCTDDGCTDDGCTDDGRGDYECVYSKEIIRYANLKYGRKLIACRDETLHEFAKGELSVYTKLKNKLQASPSANAGQRMEQIDKQIQAIQYVLEF